MTGNGEPERVGQGRSSGRRPTSVAFINLQDIAGGRRPACRCELASPSRLAWDGAALTIDALDLTVGQGRLLAAGRLGEGGLGAARWQSTFKGELGDILRIGRPLGVPDALDGHRPGDDRVELNRRDRSVRRRRSSSRTAAWRGARCRRFAI